MARLIYSAITSLDGYVADADGRFDWAVPDDEVHTFVNDLGAERRHLPLRASDVRGDGRLGDRARRAGPARLRAGLRGDLAGRRQGGVLDHPGGRVQRGRASSATSMSKRSGT